MRSVGTEAQRSSPLLLAVLVAASLILTTVYFREGDGGPLHRTRAGFLAVTSPVVHAGRWLTTPLRWTGDRIGGLTVSRSEVTKLRTQNEQLRKRNVELEEAALENERLRALVGFGKQERFDALAAHIIGRPTVSWEGAMTIDRGADDGVAPGMPVVAERGLIGQVVTVSGGSARVRLITDQRSGVAAMVQRTRAEGVVRGSVEGALTLEFVPAVTGPKVGDVVLTSGMGGIYPKGLPVGEIVEVEGRESDLYPRIVVSPLVPLAQIEEVEVLRSGAPGGTGGDPE